MDDHWVLCCSRNSQSDLADLISEQEGIVLVSCFKWLVTRVHDLERGSNGNTVPTLSDSMEGQEPFSTCLASLKTIQQRPVALAC